MNTRFSSLVKIKKNEMQNKEQAMQRANADLDSAMFALEVSSSTIHNIKSPKDGLMSNLLASRSLLDSGRHLIDHNKQWVKFAQEQVKVAKEALKVSMVEYEKFKYLELEEMKKMIKLQQEKESKDLDEVALMIHQRKTHKEVSV